MGKQVDKLKAKYKADRISDPHGWAYEIERRADQRSLTGGVALLACFALGWFVYTLKQEQDLMRAQIDNLQVDNRPVGYGTPAYYADPNYEPPPPPPGYEIVP